MSWKNIIKAPLNIDGTKGTNSIKPIITEVDALIRKWAKLGDTVFWIAEMTGGSRNIIGVGAQMQGTTMVPVGDMESKEVVEKLYHVWKGESDADITYDGKDITIKFEKRSD
tara:strand:+ start:4143 stop:4478 length:336 start_codon:yes stop_codon:yes gene_type:complete